MEDKSTIIPIYSPLDGVVDGHWTYHPDNGDPNARWCHDNNPRSWNSGWGHENLIHRRPKPNSLWNVKEVEKTAEIKDNFGFERFKVYLYASEEQTILSSSVEEINFPNSPDQETNEQSLKPINKKVGWRVTTTSLLPNGDWEPIFDSELFSKLEDATRCYDDNVKEYSLIAKVETKHYQDIKIYAEKIGYHKVEECCATCRWCHKKMHQEPHEVTIRHDKFMPDPKKHENRLVCTNYKLFAKRLTDIERPDFDALRIQPEVRPDCICNHFEKRLPPHDPKFPNHCYDQYGDDIQPRPPKLP